MPRLFRRKKDNAWIESDRSERHKLLAATAALALAVLAGIGLLAYALLRH